MSRFRKKLMFVEATQWFQNGDHPDDRVGKRELDEVALFDAHPELLQESGQVGPIPDDAPTYERLEGAVVRYFRHPDYPDDVEHSLCGRLWHDHGWIDDFAGSRIVCPGDWVITNDQGRHYPMPDSIFQQTYEPA